MNTWYFDFIRKIEYKAKWTLNGSEIISKGPITITCDKIGNGYVDVLNILSIKEYHFGKYQLWFSFNIMNSTMKNFTMIEILIAQLYLFQADDIVSYVYSPVGNAVILRYYIPLSVLSAFLRDGNFTFEYEIDSKLIGKTTLDKQSSRLILGCSIFTTIALWNYKLNKIELATNHSRRYFSICLCTPSISFGIHSIIFRKFFFNKTAKSKQNVRLVLPTKYIVLPEKSCFIKNNSYDKYKTAKYTDGIDLSHEEKYLFIRNMSELFKILCAYCFAIIFFKKTYTFMKNINAIFCNVFCKYILGYTNKNTLNSHNDCLGNIIETPKYINMNCLVNVLLHPNI